MYEMVVDRRSQPVGPRNWLGNLRWIAKEEKEPLSYTFLTAPINMAESDMHDGKGFSSAAAVGSRTLFGLEISGAGEVERYLYRPDGLEISGKAIEGALHFPFERYGVVLKLASAVASRPSVLFRTSRLAGRTSRDRVVPELQVNGGTLVVKDGQYSIVFRHNGNVEPGKDGETFRIFPDTGNELVVAIAFHLDPDTALDEAETLFSDPDGEIAASRSFWEDYLQSCPVTEYKEEYRYFDTFQGREVVFNAAEIRVRQLWHWVSVLSNVYQIEFNDWKTYMSPDKPLWFGSWSNDVSESLAALSATNAAPLARACIIDYIRESISDKGVLSWYTHSYGEGCYDRVGDSGRYSHGVPNIVHTVGYYIRRTGDRSILDEPIKGGATLWDKLKQYIVKVFEQRDVNGDGLVEWNNLWETGWDDKSGPFFSTVERKAEIGPHSTVAEWVKIVSTGTPEEYEIFRKENANPVTAMVSQCYFLWALESMVNLCDLKGDAGLKKFCGKRHANIVDVVRTRHWNKDTEFYHDWDVRRECLHDAKSLDAFYFMGFENDPARLSILMEHFNNPDEFALMYPPTLSKDSKDFNAGGYWCGGYWPRESIYLGLALDKVGFKQQAEEIVLKALCSAKGKVVAENMNSLTGESSTHVTSMAYSSALPLVLQEIRGENLVPYFEYN